MTPDKKDRLSKAIVTALEKQLGTLVTVAIASKKSLRRNLLANEVEITAAAIFPSGAAVSDIDNKMQV
jgi:hypothetical protein